MRASMLVLERNRRKRTAAKADLRRLHVADQRVRAVAAYLFLVNQLDRRPWREPVQIVTIRKRVLQRVDDWLGDSVLPGVMLEAVFDRKRHLDRTNVVLDGPNGGLQYAGAEACPYNSVVFVEIVLEAAHLAGLGILIQGQRVPAVKIPVRGNLLDVRCPLMRVVSFHPCFAKVAFDRRGAVEHRADGDGWRRRLS